VTRPRRGLTVGRAWLRQGARAQRGLLRMGRGRRTLTSEGLVALERRRSIRKHFAGAPRRRGCVAKAARRLPWRTVCGGTIGRHASRRWLYLFMVRRGAAGRPYPF
jgi:hypothetical protein